MSKVYRAKDSGTPDIPDYVIHDGRFYRTVNHPAGWSDSADYEIRSDGRVYAAENAGHAGGPLPVYEFKNLMLYRTRWHPDGMGEQPDYYIFD